MRNEDPFHGYTLHAKLETYLYIIMNLKKKLYEKKLLQSTMFSKKNNKVKFLTRLIFKK